MGRTNETRLSVSLKKCTFNHEVSQEVEVQFQHHISALLSDKEMLLYLLKEILVYLLRWCIIDACGSFLSVRQAVKVMKIQLKV